VTEHVCIDCRKDPPATVRKIANPGDTPPRCTTHLRRFQTRQKQLRRGSHVERTYEISAADNGALLVAQGGRCWICRKATGASKLLATDHDHADDWVRGRLCSTCNQFIGRQLGDDPEAARRLVSYLSGDTPYRRLLASRLLQETYGVTVTLDQVRVELTADDGVAIWWLEPGNVWNVNYSQTLDTLERYAGTKG
jgi:hypothetical protein